MKIVLENWSLNFWINLSTTTTYCSSKRDIQQVTEFIEAFLQGYLLFFVSLFGWILLYRQKIKKKHCEPSVPSKWKGKERKVESEFVFMFCGFQYHG